MTACIRLRILLTKINIERHGKERTKNILSKKKKKCFDLRQQGNASFPLQFQNVSYLGDASRTLKEKLSDTIFDI